jgi:hypothetical protein
VRTEKLQNEKKINENFSRLEQESLWRAHEAEILSRPPRILLFCFFGSKFIKINIAPIRRERSGGARARAMLGYLIAFRSQSESNPSSRLSLGPSTRLFQ